MADLQTIPVYRKTEIVERSEDGINWTRTEATRVGLRILDGPVTSKRETALRLIGASVTFRPDLKPYVEVRGRPLKKDGTDSQRSPSLIWSHDWDQQVIEAAEKARSNA